MKENRTGEEVEDGRRLRTVRTRAEILRCCRRMMVSGDIRPSAEAIAQAANCSRRTIFARPGALYAEAVDDVETAGPVLSHALGKYWHTCISDPWLSRLARAILAGDKL
jgi:hypothetical protein